MAERRTVIAGTNIMLQQMIPRDRCLGNVNIDAATTPVPLEVDLALEFGSNALI